MNFQNIIYATFVVFIALSCSQPCNADPLFNLFKPDFKKIESFDNDVCVKRGAPLFLADFTSCIVGPRFGLDHISNDLKQIKTWNELFNPYLRQCRIVWPRERKCHQGLYSELLKCYEERDFFWVGMYSVTMNFICDDITWRRISDVFKNGAWECFIHLARHDVAQRLQLCFQSRSINDLSSCLNSLSSICTKETTRNDVRALLEDFSESYEMFQLNITSTYHNNSEADITSTSTSTSSYSSSAQFLQTVNAVVILLVLNLLL